MDIRWTGRLGALLGPDYHIIEEGLPGRTTVFEDPLLPGRNGSIYLYPCLLSHAPLDLLLLMLGTNDCKMRFGASAQNIAAGMAALVRTASLAPIWRDVPHILLLAPPPLTARCFDESAGAEPGEACALKSRHLAVLYQQVARNAGCEFLDTGTCVQVSETDGTHWDVPAHRALADILETRVKRCLEQE